MLLRLVIGMFIVLHGLVHLLYAGQSGRRFELRPGMVWPDGSWAFSRLLGDQATRLLATICCILAAVGFAAGGIGILLGQAWWNPAVTASAALSTAMFFLFWNGKLQRLPDQGLIAILINGAILVAVLILRWPDYGF